MEHLDQYWAAVQEGACRKCIDGDGKGNCRLSGNEACGLKLHFPTIVASINSMNSASLDAYVQVLRRDVCSSCKYQSIDGACLLRTQLDCGLDRYFPLVVEAIEEVKSRIDESPEAFGD